MHTPLWRGSILINVVRGSKVSQARPLGQVHRDGHAIFVPLSLYGIWQTDKLLSYETKKIFLVLDDLPDGGNAVFNGELFKR